ncbi:class I poly(R)-hydroxyalkanoic acid synthase [Hydrogenophilus islandicus]
MSNGLHSTSERMAEVLHQMAEESWDPIGVAAPLVHAAYAWATHPVELSHLWGEALETTGRWQQFVWRRVAGDAAAQPPFPPVADDSRWDHPAWQDHPLWAGLQQAYFGATRFIQDAIYAAPGVAERERRRAAFWHRVFANAWAPTNFLWTNPEAQRRLLASGGESLWQGVKNFWADMAAGQVRMSRTDDFRVGENLATTPGQVVAKSALAEVIRYRPSTPTQYARPLVIVPPWINKFYILDLTPEKSLVQFLRDAGFDVFLISWRNPTPEMAATTFDDYLRDGIDLAVETARSLSGADRVQAVGYCLGGTALASYAAVKGAELGEKTPLASATFFTTLVDFAAPGDIEVFIDPGTVRYLCHKMALTGYLDGGEMAAAFRLLRSNSLIWHYVVHGWLYGEEPPPFDVLYWNMDTTRMPAAMHCWYLRELYLNNRLVKPGTLVLLGQPVDLRAITVPIYAVGAEDDHIAPWRQTYRLLKQVRGPKRYVLSSSGHILGIVNPPRNPPKRHYRASDFAEIIPKADEWFAATEPQPNSWWNDWLAWLQRGAGERVAASDPQTWPNLGAAPGAYVLQ